MRTFLEKEFACVVHRIQESLESDGILESACAQRNEGMHKALVTGGGGQQDVSVILNLYKRPYALIKQLRAIEAQSLRPKEILLYQDGVFEGICIPDEIKDSFDEIEISESNKGVWARFDFARRKAQSPLICVFDDDTIPGVDFLANCFSEMQKQEGLYGGNGVVFCYPEYYPRAESSFNIGHYVPNERTMQVDFVGHAWFFKKEWLEDLFTNTQVLQDYKIAGEDIAFSLALQRKGIKTFVPPHPLGQENLWSSVFADTYGTEENIALHRDSKNFPRKRKMVRDALKLGFEPLVCKDKQAFLTNYHSYIKKGKLSKLRFFIDSWIKPCVKPMEKKIRVAIKKFLGIKKYQKR
ncbi:glycosyltransferase family 2 protein [Helicobacter sp. MIT 14-3879]|uniref:glycosyltransferase n=1 Tax=Helicobacter sp. MIT 14-3879 TaxID=2040649 RepID=UPI000E1E8850|nr:glycosyltransferase family 2 protein [Helicobacter sp. MIT 14-3879]RDU61230.1 hypothetical protein CQA44_09675 [Helicobacter sp. MIT 14-3879]